MSFRYVLKEGFSGFKRARLSAFSSITAITLAVVLLALLARVSYNAYYLAQAIKSDVQIEVFLEDVDQARTNALKNSFLEHDVVDEIEYISKERAMEIFRAEFGPGSEVLGSVNFLPASFRIKTKTDVPVSSIVFFVDEIKTYVGVEDVKFNQRGLEVLEERLQLFVFGGILAGLIIGLTALVLVFNTIRLTIYAKRDLIKAMKLVGATNALIRRPFLVEGMLHGMVASILATGFIWVLFHVFIPYYIPQAGILSWPFGRWYFLTGAIFFIAILMGLIGSRWASSKFINRTSIS
jgi:cell division transport system permease protein